jgi:hypothetical protein
MAALPSFHEDGDTQNAPRKAETGNCRSRSQQSTFITGDVLDFLEKRVTHDDITIQASSTTQDSAVRSRSALYFRKQGPRRFCHT